MIKKIKIWLIKKYWKIASHLLNYIMNFGLWLSHKKGWCQQCVDCKDWQSQFGKFGGVDCHKKHKRIK